MPQPCGACGHEATLKCSGCMSVRYCSKQHQRLHWPLHKTICKHFIKYVGEWERSGEVTTLAGHATSTGFQQPRKVTGKPKLAAPADWIKGLSKSAASEWLVDCYRMRVDDDFAWGGGKQHGLYHPQCTPKSMAADFFMFAQLAAQHGRVRFICR